MAHWAKLDENSTVVQVLVADDDKQEWLTERLGGVWVQTSYNTRGGVHLLGGEPLRYNYAGIGYTFDPTKGTDGAFIPPKPSEDAVLNEETCLWEIPAPSEV